MPTRHNDLDNRLNDPVEPDTTTNTQPSDDAIVTNGDLPLPNNVMVIQYVLRLLSAFVRKMFLAMGDTVAGTAATVTSNGLATPANYIASALRTPFYVAGGLLSRSPLQGGGDDTPNCTPVLRLRPDTEPASERTPLLSREHTTVAPRPEAVEAIEDIEPIDEAAVPGHQPPTQVPVDEATSDADVQVSAALVAPTPEPTAAPAAEAGKSFLLPISPVTFCSGLSLTIGVTDDDTTPMDVDAVVTTQEATQAAAPAPDVVLQGGEPDATAMEVDTGPTPEHTQEIAPAADPAPQAGESILSPPQGSLQVSPLTLGTAGESDATSMDVDTVPVVVAAAAPPAATTTTVEASAATTTTLTMATAQESDQPIAIEERRTEDAMSDDDMSDDFDRALGDARPVDRRPDLTERENRPFILGPAPPQGPPYILDPVTRRFPLAAPMASRTGKKLKVQFSADGNTVFHYLQNRRRGVLIGKSKSDMKTESLHQGLEPGSRPRRPPPSSPGQLGLRANDDGHHAPRRALQIVEVEQARRTPEDEAARLALAEAQAAAAQAVTEGAPASDVAATLRTVPATINSCATETTSTLVPAMINRRLRRDQPKVPIVMPPKPEVVTRRKKEGHEDEEDDEEKDDPRRKRFRFEPKSDDLEYESEGDSADFDYQWDIRKWGRAIIDGDDNDRHDKGKGSADPLQEASWTPKAGPSRRDKGKGKAPPPPEPLSGEVGENEEPMGEAMSEPAESLDDTLLRTGIAQSLVSYDSCNDWDDWSHTQTPNAGPSRSTPEASPADLIAEIYTPQTTNQAATGSSDQPPHAGPSRSTPEASPADLLAEMYMPQTPSQPAAGSSEQPLHARPSMSISEAFPADLIAQMFASPGSSQPAPGSSSDETMAESQRSDPGPSTPPPPYSLSPMDLIRMSYEAANPTTQETVPTPELPAPQPLDEGRVMPRERRGPVEPSLLRQLLISRASRSPTPESVAMRRGVQMEDSAPLSVVVTPPSVPQEQEEDPVAVSPSSSRWETDGIIMPQPGMKEQEINYEVLGSGDLLSPTPETSQGTFASRMCQPANTARQMFSPSTTPPTSPVVSPPIPESYNQQPYGPLSFEEWWFDLMMRDVLGALPQHPAPSHPWHEPNVFEWTGEMTGKVENYVARVPSAPPEGAHQPWLLSHIFHQRYDNNLIHTIEQMKPGVADGAWFKLQAIRSIHFSPHCVRQPYTRDLSKGLSYLDIYSDCMSHLHRISMTREMMTYGYDHEHRDLVGPHTGKLWRELERPTNGYASYGGRRIEEIVFEYRRDSTFNEDMTYHLSYHLPRVATIVERWIDWAHQLENLLAEVGLVVVSRSSSRRVEKLRVVFEPKAMTILPRVHLAVSPDRSWTDRCPSQPSAAIARGVFRHIEGLASVCRKWVPMLEEEDFNILSVAEHHMQGAAEVQEAIDAEFPVAEGRVPVSLRQAVRAAKGRSDDDPKRDFPLWEYLHQSAKIVEL